LLAGLRTALTNLGRDFDTLRMRVDALNIGLRIVECRIWIS
jgi:hypothetical protein